MNQYKQFQNALVLNEFDKGCNYELDNRYFVGKTPHGGYLNALMHKALISKLPHTSACLLYTSPSPRDRQKSRMPSSA